ncbi:hypothetical protein VIBNISO65_1600004 [Vibrio nigripulchritudo SO65]|nr:hypothetical protein VIBNIFTn2_1190004 [Vibrio nigripulchritudo FTn2]CCN68005.1 hypothetical protein VIBNIPon4_930004 [Vibrio nigripulchritudo POn4]CCN76613.1 hypothetical protein VIBNISO65_1600004 [Vibrio nigripulchritudo SO65]
MVVRDSNLVLDKTLLDLVLYDTRFA